MMLHALRGSPVASSGRCGSRAQPHAISYARTSAAAAAPARRRGAPPPAVAAAAAAATAAAAAFCHPHIARSRRPVWCRSSLQPDAIPAEVKLEVDPDSAAKQATYDEATKTVRIPLAAMADGQRRTKMVMFTCNKCGGRSARLVNPLAWEKGAVFAQCQHCDVWHTLAAAPHIIEEIRYNDPPQPQPAAAAPAGASEGSQESTSTAVADGGSVRPGDDEATSAPKQE